MKRRICIIVLALTIVFTSIVPIFAIQEDCPREAPHRTIVAANDYHGYAGVTTSSKKRGISAKITMPSDFPDVSGSGESAWVSTSKDSNGEWVQAGARYYSSYTAFKTYTEHYQNGVYKLTTVGTHRLGIYLSTAFPRPCFSRRIVFLCKSHDDLLSNLSIRPCESADEMIS